jgi:phosphatidate cytidylyltransferase
MQQEKDASEVMMPFIQLNIIKRTLVSLIIIPLVGTIVYFGKDVYTVAVLVLAFGMSREWLRLTHPEGSIAVNNLFYLTLFGSFIFWLSGLYLWATLYFVAVMGCFYGSVKVKNFKHPGFMSFGLFYIFVPLIAAIWLRVHTEDGLLHLLFVLLTVMSTDIAAYFSGKFIGGPKLAPMISPNKTWAGFFGGLCGAMIMAFAYVHFSVYEPPFSLFPLTIVVSMSGQIGDLIESFVKRHFGVKDTGTLLPGHGGLFDRLDSYLIAVPVMSLIVYFV